MPLYLGNKLISGSERLVETAPSEGSENLVTSGGVKKYVDEQISTIPTPDVSGQIGEHNLDEAAHPDIREAIENIPRTSITIREW